MGKLFEMHHARKIFLLLRMQCTRVAFTSPKSTCRVDWGKCLHQILSETWEVIRGCRMIMVARQAGKVRYKKNRNLLRNGR